MWYREELKDHHPKCKQFQKHFYYLFVGLVEGSCCRLLVFPTINHHLHQIWCAYLSVTVVLTLHSLTEEGEGQWILTCVSNHSSQTFVCKFVLIVCGLLSQKVLEYIDRGKLIDWVSIYAAMGNYYPCWVKTFQCGCFGIIHGSASHC